MFTETPEQTVARIQQMALWGSCVLRGIILDFTFGGKQLKSAEEGGKSHDQILLCTPSPFLTLLVSGRSWCFTGQTCLEHTSTQEWESSRVKTPFIVSAEVVTDSGWFCIGFVILMDTILLGAKYSTLPCV